MPAQREPLTGALISSRLFGFIALLRANGFNLGANDIKAAHVIAAEGGIDSEVRLHTALRAIFCQSQTQWQAFPVLFAVYWHIAENADEDTSDYGDEQEADSVGQNAPSGAGASGLSYFSESLAQAKTLDDDESTLDEYVGGASESRTFAQRDFRFVFNPRDMRRIERVVDEISQRMQKRLRRRARQDHSRGRLDARRTARSSLRHGGWPFDLHLRGKQRTPARFLLLLDVSQSMEIYSYLFLRFARGLLQAFKETDAYAFHTDLIHIGNELRHQSPQQLESRLKKLSSGWLGGTRIAESLKHFNRDHAKHAVHKDTIVIVFSDGYDSGEPADLVTEVLALKARCRKLVWVNPLLGRGVNAEPLPVERSLHAVLPHLDLYTSAHSLNSLKNLEPAFSNRQ